MFSISSINLCSPCPYYVERLETAIHEAPAEVLCFQEVSALPEVAEYITKHTNYQLLTPNIPLTAPVTPSTPIILTTRPIISHGFIPALNKHSRAFPWVHILYQDFHVLVISVHLYWGGTKEYERFQEIKRIETLAQQFQSEHENTAVILAGDFNTQRESISIRFLKGETFDPITGEGSFWTEAGLQDDTHSLPTTRDTGEWGAFIGKQQGSTNLQYAVPRKIDFIFVRGWKFGQPFTPINFRLFGNTTPNGHDVSDHYGVYSEFYV